MRITLVGHASMLVETATATILTDPWWAGPSYGQQWWNYPAPEISVLDGKRVEFIYISHGHHDHLHPDTLRTLPRDATVLVSAAGSLAPWIRELGFKVEEISPDEERSLTETTRIRLMPTHSDDTLLAITDGKEVCVNLNDALHSAPSAVQDAFMARLRALYPKIDYLFCGYGIASHFPNCYRIPGKNMAATTAQRQRHFNRQWARIVAGLSPQFAFPFAADVVFLEEDLLWTYEPTCNAERPTAALAKEYPGFRGQAIDIAPGFQVTGGAITADIRRVQKTEERLRTELALQIVRANDPEAVAWQDVQQVHDLLIDNIARTNEFLASFIGDYTFVIRLRGSAFGFLIRKTGPDIGVKALEHAARESHDAQITFITRLSYLRASLAEPYGDEIIFVGSGGIFEYADRSDVPRALHRELAAIIRRHSRPPRRIQDTHVRRVKRLVKKLLGVDSIDPYDLNLWTVYEDARS